MRPEVLQERYNLCEDRYDRIYVETLFNPFLHTCDQFPGIGCAACYGSEKRKDLIKAVGMLDQPSEA